jgi:hypothetical protein
MTSRTFAYSPRVERDRHYFGFLQAQSKQDKAAHRLIRRLTRRHLYSGATFNGKRQYVEVRSFDPRLALHPTALSNSIEVLLDGTYRRVGA